VFNVCGETADISDETAANCVAKLPSTMGGYEPKYMFIQNKLRGP
jgi:hypothetical protein